MNNSTTPGSTDATGLFTAKNPYEERATGESLKDETNRIYQRSCFAEVNPSLFCYNENNQLVKGVEGLEVKGPVWQYKYETDPGSSYEWDGCLDNDPTNYEPLCETRHVYIAVQPTEKADLPISNGGLPDRKAVESDKYTYFKIEFKNCSMPYDYTICPEHEIQAQMTDAISSFDGWDLFGEEKPEIIISPVIMSHEEYDKWFKDNVEDNA